MATLHWNYCLKPISLAMDMTFPDYDTGNAEIAEANFVSYGKCGDAYPAIKEKLGHYGHSSDCHAVCRDDAAEAVTMESHTCQGR